MPKNETRLVTSSRMQSIGLLLLEAAGLGLLLAKLVNADPVLAGKFKDFAKKVRYL